MWKHALKDTDSVRQGLVHSVDDLEAQEVVPLLESVHRSLKSHEHMRVRGGQPLVKKNLGPRSWTEWVEEPDRRAYNGEDGGRVYSWYTPAKFQEELHRMGVERATCNERQAEEALRITSARLAHNEHAQLHGLQAFAGPQCYCHVKCLRTSDSGRTAADANRGCGACANCERFYVNELPAASSGGTAAAEEARCQLTECWMRCDVCRRRRLVSRMTWDALHSEAFARKFA